MEDVGGYWQYFEERALHSGKAMDRASRPLETRKSLEQKSGIQPIQNKDAAASGLGNRIRNSLRAAKAKASAGT